MRRQRAFCQLCQVSTGTHDRRTGRSLRSGASGPTLNHPRALVILAIYHVRLMKTEDQKIEIVPSIVASYALFVSQVFASSGKPSFPVYCYIFNVVANIGRCNSPNKLPKSIRWENSVSDVSSSSLKPNQS